MWTSINRRLSTSCCASHLSCPENVFFLTRRNFWNKLQSIPQKERLVATESSRHWVRCVASCCSHPSFSFSCLLCLPTLDTLFSLPATVQPPGTNNGFQESPNRLRIGVAQAEKSWIGPVMGPAVVLRERFGGEDPWDISVFEPS